MAQLGIGAARHHPPNLAEPVIRTEAPRRMGEADPGTHAVPSYRASQATIINDCIFYRFEPTDLGKHITIDQNAAAGSSRD